MGLMRLKFTEEFFENARSEGYEVDGVMFDRMADKLYAEWLEKKLDEKIKAIIPDKQSVFSTVVIPQGTPDSDRDLIFEQVGNAYEYMVQEITKNS